MAAVTHPLAPSSGYNIEVHYRPLECVGHIRCLDRMILVYHGHEETAQLLPLFIETLSRGDFLSAGKMLSSVQHCASSLTGSPIERIVVINEMFGRLRDQNVETDNCLYKIMLKAYTEALQKKYMNT